MATPPRSKRGQTTAGHLAPFDPAHAERIVSWVRDAQEMYWLAPKTPPPITSDNISAWKLPGHHPFLLYVAGRNEPVGYGEVNRLSAGTARYWLGHLIVDPAERGRGLGVTLSRLLLRMAFERLHARHVTLVVFPENRAAVACYRAAGMLEDGWETHEFEAYGRVERLLRFVAPPPGPNYNH